LLEGFCSRFLSFEVQGLFKEII